MSSELSRRSMLIMSGALAGPALWVPRHPLLAAFAFYAMNQTTLLRTAGHDGTSPGPSAQNPGSHIEP